MKAQKAVALAAVLQGTSWEALPEQLQMDPELLRAKEMRREGIVPLDVPKDRVPHAVVTYGQEATCPERKAWHAARLLGEVKNI